MSLQNCMNEETIAGIVGWGKTLGCIASSITVNLPEPGHIHRGAGKGGAAHTVFRAGEVHGRITDARRGGVPAGRLRRQRQGHATTCGASAGRSSSPTSWATASPPAPACPARRSLQNEPLRRFSTRLGSEAIRVGQALGYQLEEILHLPPETIARAGEGDAAADEVVRRAAPQGRGKRLAASSAPRWART